MWFSKKKKRLASRKTSTAKLSAAQEKLYLRMVVALVLFLLAILLFAPGAGLLSLSGKRSELARIEMETSRTEEQNQGLEEDIDSLLNDPEFLEEVARKDHQLLRKNEKVYDFSKEQQE